MLTGLVFRALAFAKDEPKWIEVHSAHFSVLTDAGDKRGREVALRMEQMRSVFGQLILKDKLKMSVPITVVALKSDKQYGLVAPTKQSRAGGFYVPGSDRIYIVLNLFEVDPWRAVAHPLAHYFLNYNYPPAQGWFDEGLAEYFGSIHIGKQVEIGGDPELAPEWHEDIFDEMRRDPNVPQSLTQLVSSPVWLSMVDLFTMKHDGSGAREGTHNTLYYAQSWMVVHYLVNKNKMPEAGTYFDLVQNQKVPVEKAMVQAFDMSPAQMEEAVKTYFKSLSGLGIALDQSKKPIANPVEHSATGSFRDSVRRGRHRNGGESGKGGGSESGDWRRDGAHSGASRSGAARFAAAGGGSKRITRRRIADWRGTYLRQKKFDAAAR